MDTYGLDPGGVFLLAAKKVAVYLGRSQRTQTMTTLVYKAQLWDIHGASVNKSNVAIMLMAELVYESDAVISGPSLPLLLQLAVVGLD